MRNLIVVVVMSLYSLGNIVFPNVDMAHLFETYKQCETEDPDINLADFVFEHLLNIPDIFEDQEKDEDDKSEKPHQPIHMVSSSQIAVVVGKPVLFECRSIFFNDGAIIYSAFKGQYLPTCVPERMLRPPIV